MNDEKLQIEVNRKMKEVILEFGKELSTYMDTQVKLLLEHKQLKDRVENLENHLILLDQRATNLFSALDSALNQRGEDWEQIQQIDKRISDLAFQISDHKNTWH